MQYSKFAVVMGVVGLVACGGDKTPAPPPQAAPPAATSAPTGAPITGKIEVVQMIGDEKGQRYDPAVITIKAGDGIRFDAISMSPHNVSFDPAALTPAAKAALLANMPNQDVGELSGKTLNNGESYTISFGNVPPGTYEAICVPHAATGMKMKITVQ